MLYTENYQFRKPIIGVDIADAKDLNFNSDKLDALLYNTQISLAPAYDLLKTYNTGDIVMYETLMYKCKADNVTGAWDASKWERTTAGEEGSGGGGGSSVVPNPSGTPTDTLNTIGIDGTIFDIAGSGGGTGESSFYKETTLWSGSDSATMQLSESFENYDAIMLVGKNTYNNVNYSISGIWLTSYLKTHINDGMRFGLANDSWYVYFSITNGTTLVRQDQYSVYISEIKGLKFGGGAGSGFSQSLLYDSGSATTGAPFNQDVALLDNLSKYDALVVEWNTSEDRSRELPLETSDTVFCTVQDLLSNNFCLHFSGYDTRWGEITFTDTTFKFFERGGDLTPQIYKIKGLKFDGGGAGSGGGASEYIPYSNKNNIVCEATLNNFDASSLEWGDGESPIILSQTVSMYNNEAVSIPVNTSGVIAYSDIGGNKQPFTAYMVCKAQTSGNYTRLLSALESHATNMGAMIFGTNNINIGSWNGSTPTGLSATSDYIVCAIQYIGYGLGYCKVNNIDLSPFPLIGSNRYITIGRTDGGSDGDQEPCDILVKYFGVVEGTDTHKAINENVAYLMDKFGIN